MLEGFANALAALWLLIEPYPILPCAHDVEAGTLVVQVRDPTKHNAPVRYARITITASDRSQELLFSLENGDTIELRVPPGPYRVSAQLIWHLPDPSPEVQAVVVVNQRTVVPIQLEELRFHLHVDADRDGVVDDDRSRNYPWNWGATLRGAVVLVNNDDDSLPALGQPDNADAVINGQNDRVEIAPLQVRRAGSALDPPASWHVELSIEPERRPFLRIFAGRLANSAEIIGPTTGATFDINLAGFQTTTYGMEATLYPGRYNGALFNGRIDIRLKVRKELQGREAELYRNPTYSEIAQVMVAPWIVPNHLDRADRVYVTGHSPGFVQRLTNMVQAAGCTLVQKAGMQRFVQDVMEIGYSVLPGAPHHRIESVMKVPQASAIPRSLLGPDVGYHEQGNHNAVQVGTFNAGGNIEVTPPARDQGGGTYPWGRILYGPGSAQHPHAPVMDADLIAFLRAQRVQSPIPLDTNWLTVGHVDEILSFVPFANPGNPYKRWKLLLASPRCAYQILHGANPLLNLLVGRTFQGRNAQMTVNTFLTGATPVTDPRPAAAGPTIPGPDLENFNNAVQLRIDAVRDTLVPAIDLDINADVIEVPVVVFPEDANFSVAGFLTADMVNMLVINGHCIIPRPFGPELATGADLFQHELRRQLMAIGLTCHFIDDWDTYHLQFGEVHCGTNTLRRPADRNAWAATAAARWWEFEG